MRRNKVIGLAATLLMLLGLWGCPGTTGLDDIIDENGVFMIGGNGGPGAVGGNGGRVVIVAAGLLQILPVGEVPIPEVVMPDGAVIISQDKTWTDADNVAVYNGLAVMPGVTITVPDNLIAGGIEIMVGGPVVMMGNIVRGSNTNGLQVDVAIGATEVIVVLGKVDMTGPDSDDGLDGGDIVFMNGAIIIVPPTLLEGDAPTRSALEIEPGIDQNIYIAGSLVSRGGNATSGEETDGGDGGEVLIFANPFGNIHVGANIVVDGGEGYPGAGVGGNGGRIVITNAEMFVAPTNGAALRTEAVSSANGGPAPEFGEIQLYYVRQLYGHGGVGEIQGGNARGFRLMSFLSGVHVLAPLNFNGGDATDTEISFGGNSAGLRKLGTRITSGRLAWEEIFDLTPNADIHIAATINMNGGKGACWGGDGGWLKLRANEGSLTSATTINLAGGHILENSACMDSQAGWGGFLDVVVRDIPLALFEQGLMESDIVISEPIPEAFNVIMHSANLNGGNGGDWGGYGGFVEILNYSSGFIYMPYIPWNLTGGTGTYMDGADGGEYYEGNVQPNPF